MALNTSKCNHLPPLPFKGLIFTGSQQTNNYYRWLPQNGHDVKVHCCEHGFKTPLQLIDNRHLLILSHSMFYLKIRLDDAYNILDSVLFIKAFIVFTTLTII